MHTPTRAHPFGCDRCGGQSHSVELLISAGECLSRAVTERLLMSLDLLQVRVLSWQFVQYWECLPLPAIDIVIATKPPFMTERQLLGRESR